MNKPTWKRLISHPDSEEILSKLIIGQSSKDIHDWLASKYSTPAEKSFVLSEKSLKHFRDNYLDFYQDIQADVQKTRSALATNNSTDLELAVKSNPSYQDAILQLANNELDIEKMMARMCLAVETRIGQIYDLIQEDPRNLNTRTERAWIEMVQTSGDLLDKWARWQEKKAQQSVNITQNNISIQIIDQHISTFHDVIKKLLSNMDLESSLLFMELFNDEMAKLKMPEPGAAPSTEMKLAEVKVLNESINQKLNA
jgi:hypothetical protein